MALDFADVHASAAEIASAWRTDRAARQQRRHLERADFDRLRDAGLLFAVLPVEAGGLWQGMESSFRPL